MYSTLYQQMIIYSRWSVVRKSLTAYRISNNGYTRIWSIYFAVEKVSKSGQVFFTACLVSPLNASLRIILLRPLARTRIKKFCHLKAISRNCRKGWILQVPRTVLKYSKILQQSKRTVINLLDLWPFSRLSPWYPTDYTAVITTTCDELASCQSY